jgi:hypothetical protein
VVCRDCTQELPKPLSQKNDLVQNLQNLCETVFIEFSHRVWRTAAQTPVEGLG